MNLFLNQQPSTKDTIMKTKTMKPCSIILSLALATVGYAETTSESSQSEARAEAHAEANGNGSQTMKQTVTVTSDGNRTIKTTTTERNGVREVKREVIDAQGRVIEGGADDSEPQDDKTGPQEEPGEKVWLGVKVKAADPALREQLDLAADEGAVIELVADHSPAAKAGLKPNDIILTMDEKKVADAESLNRELQGKKAGDKVAIQYMRKGQKSSTDVTLADRPAQKNESGPARDTATRSESGTAELELKNGDSFDKVLEDPQVPENFKQSVREMQQRMKAFQEKHQPR